MPRYFVTLIPDDNDTLFVTCPALPEAKTCGEDEADALVHAAEVIEFSLDIRMHRGEEIPDPVRRRAGQLPVDLPSLVNAKVELYRLMKMQGVRKADMARALKVQRTQIDRLLDLGHATRMDFVDAAFQALGHSLTFKVSNAAPAGASRRDIIAKVKPRAAAKGKARTRRVA